MRSVLISFICFSLFRKIFAFARLTLPPSQVMYCAWAAAITYSKKQLLASLPFAPFAANTSPAAQSASSVSTSTGPAVAGAPQEEAPIALDPHLLRTTFPMTFSSRLPRHITLNTARPALARVVCSSPKLPGWLQKSVQSKKSPPSSWRSTAGSQRSQQPMQSVHHPRLRLAVRLLLGMYSPQPST